jgi:DNA-binding NarL/FixJ family response regulator
MILAAAISMTKILIADDSSLVRPMLAAALSSRNDWTICGEASNGRQAILLAFQLRPDLILLDFLMPMLSGLDAAAEILKIMPLVPIVLYTMYENAQLEAEAKKIGIRKVVSKANSSKLVAALEEVLGKPHQIGPLLVGDEYKVEPIQGEDSASAAPIKPPRKPGHRLVSLLTSRLSKRIR